MNKNSFKGLMKHLEVAKAYYEEGKEVEYYNAARGWVTCVAGPAWCYGDQYRVKPAPKSAFIVRAKGGNGSVRGAHTTKIGAEYLRKNFVCPDSFEVVEYKEVIK